MLFLVEDQTSGAKPADKSVWEQTPVPTGASYKDGVISSLSLIRRETAALGVVKCKERPVKTSRRDRVLFLVVCLYCKSSHSGSRCCQNVHPLNSKKTTSLNSDGRDQDDWRCYTVNLCSLSTALNSLLPTTITAPHCPCCEACLGLGSSFERYGEQ